MRNSIVALSIAVFSTSVGHAQSSFGAGPSQAGNGAVDGVADIVVTAERRSGSLQRTPIAVTALSGEALAQAQIREISDIGALVPSMRIGENSGVAQITLRGIGISSFVPGAEGAVAFNLNGIYVSRPIAQLSSLYDIATVEVLRGPQGTLYGRNATAGSLNVNTTMPTEELSGYGRVTMGNYNTRHFDAAVGGPVAGDKLLVRLAASLQHHSGYARNVKTGNDVNDLDSQAVRFTILAKPTETLSATLIAEYFHENDARGAYNYLSAVGLTGLPGTTGTPPIFQTLGFSAPTGKREVSLDFDPVYKLETFALTGKLQWLAGDFTLTSLSGYRDQKAYLLRPGVGAGPTIHAFVSGEPAHQFSQELQVNYDGGPLKATAGLFYFNETDTANPSDVLRSRFTFDPSARGDLSLYRRLIFRGTFRTKAQAAFGQASYALSDRLSLLAGIRFGSEEKRFDQQRLIPAAIPYPDGIVPSLTVNMATATFKSTTPRFGLNYQANSTTLFYLTYAKGFKSGAFDLAAPAGVPPVEPEKVTDYEGGIKTKLFDNKLRANLAAYYYDYTNLQVQQTNGSFLQLVNAASAKIYGFEAELAAKPSDQFELDLNLAYTHTRFGNYFSTNPAKPLLPALGGAAGANTVNYRGKKLPNAPELTVNAAAEYSLPVSDGTFSFRGELEYSSEYFLLPDNDDYNRQKPFAKVNAFLRFASDSFWRASLYAKNIANVATITSGNVVTATGYTFSGLLAAPRTFGAVVELRF